MIRSPKLEEYFKQFDYQWLYESLRNLFGVTYVKTFSELGCYTWFGGDRKEFDNNLQIDKDSPMCYIKTFNERPSLTYPFNMIQPADIFIFLNNTEDQVISKFNLHIGRME